MAGIRMGGVDPVNAGYGVSRNNVMRNTMYLLSASLIPTVIGAFVGMAPGFLMFMMRSPLIASLIMMAVMFGLVYAIQRAEVSVAVPLMLILTFAMGIWLGPLLTVVLRSPGGALIVAEAAGGTALIFAVLATVVTVTKKDFSFMGNFLFVGLILLLVASLAGMFLPIPALHLTISAIAILVFSGYLLFDMSRIIQGGETNYVMATLALYLDLYNIFTNLLYLLSALSGNDRR